MEWNILAHFKSLLCISARAAEHFDLRTYTTYTIIGASAGIPVSEQQTLRYVSCCPVWRAI